MSIALILAGADMRGNLAMAGVLLAIGSLILLAIARHSKGDRRPSRIWLPFVALIAGPLVALAGWAICFMVGGFVLVSDAWASLPSILILGAIAGIGASMSFALALQLAGPKPVTQSPADKSPLDK